MNLKCRLGLHNYDHWRCRRCHQENPRLMEARRSWKQKEAKPLAQDEFTGLFGIE